MRNAKNNNNNNQTKKAQKNIINKQTKTKKYF